MQFTLSTTITTTKPATPTRIDPDPGSVPELPGLVVHSGGRKLTQDTSLTGERGKGLSNCLNRKPGGGVRHNRSRKRANDSCKADSACRGLFNSIGNQH